MRFSQSETSGKIVIDIVRNVETDDLFGETYLYDIPIEEGMTIKNIRIDYIYKSSKIHSNELLPTIIFKDCIMRRMSYTNLFKFIDCEFIDE